MSDTCCYATFMVILHPSATRAKINAFISTHRHYITTEKEQVHVHKVTTWICYFIQLKRSIKSERVTLSFKFIGQVLQLWKERYTISYQTIPTPMKERYPGIPVSVSRKESCLSGSQTISEVVLQWGMISLLDITVLLLSKSDPFILHTHKAS